MAAPINGQSLIFNNIELVIKETLLPNMKNPSLSIKYTIYLNYFWAETCPFGHLFFMKIEFDMFIVEYRVNERVSSDRNRRTSLNSRGYH